MGSQDQRAHEEYSDGMPSMSFPELIAKKRDGHALSKDEIQQFIDGITNKTMQECQIGSMLMAIYMKGMTLEETSHLTMSMMNSGEILKWPEEWNGVIVDKHSTGGVGDKISLILAPALAASGLKNPMIAGRGLGFTGGTLDKLEAIPGFNVYQTTESMRRLLHTIGFCIVGQTETLVPADKKLYATRDVSGTVSSIPLITSSIISKKGAEGLNSLVLDVKVGCGAMMENEKDARELARNLVHVGSSVGIEMTAVLTNMDRPIGNMIGHALEIVETLECLRGRGPASTLELTEVEGGYLLYSVGKASSPEEGKQMIAKCLSDGSAMNKFCEMLKAQGVSDENADKLCAEGVDVFTVLQKAKFQTDIPVLSTGYVTDINALICAKVSYWLGGGRTKADGPIDYAVGLQMRVELADYVTKGKPWVTVHHNSELSPSYVSHLQEALVISSSLPAAINKSLIIDVISSK